MKQPIIFILSLSMALSLLSAKAQTAHVQIIQKLVQEVKHKTGDARRKAMNALKIQLRSMNQETRRQVMKDLQKSFARGGSHAITTAPHNGMHANEHRQTAYGTQTHTMQQHAGSGQPRVPQRPIPASQPVHIPTQQAPLPQPHIQHPHMPPFGKPGGGPR